MKNNGLGKNSLFTVIAVFALIFLQQNPVYAYHGSALPQGASVVNGNVNINYAGHHTLDVTASNNSIINWNSFNIGSKSTVDFIQPNSSSVVLNRVVGIDPSSIYGTLEANGRVFIVNPNGIFFGPNSQVNVYALTASTLDISNSDFLAGNYTFTGNGKNAYIINKGNIHVTNGGYVALLSQSINNSGVIEAQLGHVVLATGQTIAVVGLDDDNTISVDITAAVNNGVFGPDGAKITQAAIQNTGTIQADGGTILLNASILNGIFDNAINNSGVVQANSLVNNNGDIEIVANGGNVVLSTGSLTSANGGVNGNGGNISINSTNDISVESGATLDVSGGTLAGNGGNVDIVTPGNLDFAGTIDGSAAAGYNPGTANLDPANASIGCTPVSSTCGGFNFSADTTVWATNDITIVGNVTLDNTILYLDADNTSDVPGSWNGGSGSITKTGLFIISGDAAGGIVHFEAGSGGIGTQTSPILVSGLTSFSAIIDPSAVSGNISISNSNSSALVVNAAGVSAPGNVYLTSADGITESGPITASGLLLVGSGTFNLSNASNNVNTLASTAIGTLTYDNSGTLAVGNVSGTSGITDTGNNVTLISTGALTLTDGISAGGGTVTLNAPGVSGTGAVTANGLLLEGTGVFSLTGSNDVGTLASIATGTLTYDNSGALAVGVVGSGTGITDTNNNVTLNSTGALTLTDGISAGSGTVTLNAPGVSGTGAVTASGLLLEGTGTFNLTGSNDVGTLASTAVGSLTYDNSGALAVGVVGSGTGITDTNNNVTLNSTGALTLTDGISAGSGTVTLNAPGVSGTGAVTASGLLLEGTGVFSLTGSNDVGTLASTATGTLTYDNSGALAVGVVGSGTGITDTNNNVTLNSTGALTLTDGISAGSGTVILNAPGVSGTGAVTASGLLLEGTGTFNLTGSNDVGTLASTAVGSLTFDNSVGLTVGDVSGTLGILDTGNNVTLSTTTGNINLADDINVGTISGTVTLDPIAGGVTTTGLTAGVIAANLVLEGEGPFSLTGTDNDISSIGTINEPGQTFTLTDNVPNLTQSGSWTLGTLVLTDTAGNVSLNDSNAISALGTIDVGQTFSLTDNVSGGLTQSGVLTAGTLNLTNILSDTNLSTEPNSIQFLGTIIANGKTFSLNDVESLSETGSISAQNLLLESTGSLAEDDFTLDGTNSVGTLAANINGILEFNDGVNPLTVGTVGSVPGITTNGATLTGYDVDLISGTLALDEAIDAGSAGTVTLHTQGATESGAGVINAANLALIDNGSPSGANFILNGTNDVTTLAADINGILTFNNGANALTVGFVSDPNITGITGITTNANDAYLSSGQLTLTDNISAGTGIITLNTTAGGITQSGILTSDGLLLTGTGTDILTDANIDGTIAVNITGSLNYTDADPLIVGTVTGNAGSFSGITITGSTGVLKLTANGITLDNNVTTSGTQEYNSNVTLGGARTLSGTTITFDDLLDGAYGLTITGNAQFNNLVGSVGPLASLSVSGTSDIETTAITTTGTQTYTGAVTLSASPDLTAGSTGVDFGSTVNGADALTITGDATFNGIVGATPLTSLSVSGTSDIETTAITTTGTQTYTGAVTLSASPDLTAGSTGVDFGSTVNGADALTITGDATFNGIVGATPLTSLSVSGTSDIETTAITTTGTQTYTGAVTLSASPDLTAGSTGVDFGSTVNGADALTITGDATFNGIVGATPLTSLSVSGTSDIETTAITTTGTQTYTGAVTLSASPDLTAGSTGVDFGSTVNGADALTITGDATFNGIVGATPLTSLSVSGTSDIETTAITTTGTQTYTGAVTLSASPDLTAGSTGVDFGSTVNGADALTITGDATFNGIVGATPLTSLSVSGTSDIETTAITTTGTQTYTGAVTLSASPDLTAGSTGVDFGSTVNGADALTITGDATFNGIVGATPLTSLSVSGTSDIETTAITTTGTQTYTGAVTLSASPDLTAGSTGVDFGSTVNGADALTITGDATFNGIVGATPLTSLTVTGTTDINTTGITTSGEQEYENAVTLNDGPVDLTGSLVDFHSTNATVNGAEALTITGNAEFDGIVGGIAPALTSLLVTGTSDIEGGSVATSGDQTYSSAVTLSNNTTLTTGGNLVDFVSTITGGGKSLTIGSGTDATNATFGGTVSGLSTLYVYGTSAINGGSIGSSSTQTYGGDVTLGTNTTLTGSTITFDNLLDSVAAVPQVAYSLGITGAVVFDGKVGSVDPLASLSVSGTTAINTTAITTTGNQTYTGAVTLGDPAITLTSTVPDLVYFKNTLNGASALTIDGNAEFGGIVGATTHLTSLIVNGITDIDTTGITTTGGQEYTGAVTLASNTTLIAGSPGVDFNTSSTTVNGAHSLTIDGAAEFDGVVGGATHLTSLSVSGTSDIETTAITTTGTQTYTGAVTLSASPDLTAGSTGVDFGSTVNGADALTITGDATFNGIVGATPLTSLTVTGTTNIDTTAITTSGAQTYDGAVTLSATSIDLTSTTPGLVDFGSTVFGTSALTITGNAAFHGDVLPLSSLTVTGTTDINGGLIITTGAQTYGNAVTLSANTVLIAGSTGVDFSTSNSTVDGAYSLDIVGNAAFNGKVGSVNPLTSLLVSGTAGINADAITTSGTQTYVGDVTLGIDTTLTGTTVTFDDLLNSVSTTPYSLAITGDAVFGGAVGGTNKLDDLSVSGTSAINGGSVTTSGTQIYSGNVTLGKNTTLTGTTVTFEKLLDSVTATHHQIAYGLAIDGDAVLKGMVGSVEPLLSLSVTGTTDINGGAITTSGAQVYDKAVTLSANATLTGDGITFNNTVDSSGTTVAGTPPVVTSNDNTLTINDNGETLFNTDAVVGGTYALGSLTIDGTTTASTGTTDINGGAITTSGAQVYDNAVTLSANATLTGDGITFNNTVDSSGTTVAGTPPVVTSNDNTLTINDNGETLFNTDAVVGGTYALGSLTIDGTTTASTGTTDINGGAITTSGAQVYDNAVTLSADTTLNGTDISFDSIVDSDSVTPRSLTISDLGTTTLGGAVGGNDPLNSLDVTATVGIDINTDVVNTTGAQTYNSAVVLGDVGATTTLTGRNITFGSTLDSADGSEGLIISDGGLTTFGGGIGNTVDPLASLQVTATNGIDINGGSVTTNGAQTYNSPVALSADATLTGNNIDFISTLDGGYNLTIDDSGTTTFGAAVGSLASLASLDVLANQIVLNGPSITTSGDITLEDVAGNITLNGTIQSTNGAVNLDADHGSINANPGSVVIANANSFFSTPNGTIGVQNGPVNVDIIGNLILNIGTRIGLNSGFLTGVVADALSGNIPLVLPSNFPSPLYPPGNIFFNGIRIWPTENEFELSQANSGLLNRFVFPSAQTLAFTQVNTFDPSSSGGQSGGQGLFLYHPLTDVDSGSFDQEFQLDEGAYDFIDGDILKKGHPG